MERSNGGEAVKNMPKRAGVVPQTVKLFHEDNFARLPQLTMAWPTVEQYHPDSYPLSVLAQYLTQGKKAPFYQVIEMKNASLTIMCRMVIIRM